MSRQAGIKEFFPTDKAIESNSASTTPSIPGTPSDPPAPPPVPPTPPVLATASGLVTPSASNTTSIAAPTSLKRGASKSRQSKPAKKRARKSNSARDHVAPTASMDSDVETDADFPNGPVAIWGTTRGNFCEAQDIFKSQQSSAYHKEKIIFSMYIANFREPRDFFGRNKIITSAGGSRVKENGKGPYRRNDIKPDTVPKWEAAVDTSIFVVMGKDHPDFGNIKLPANVRKAGVIVELGQFMVTKLWKELVQPRGVKEPYPVWKIRLQTMDTTSKPWYWSENMQDANTIGDALHVEQGISNNSNSTRAPAVIVEEKTCESCGKPNPRIFDNAPWVCLEDECEQFFQVSGKVLSQIGDDNQELRYSNDFINKTVIYDIVPGRSSSMFRPLPEDLVEGSDIYGTEKALRAGLTCPKCWCCTARKYWDRLVCCYCGFEYNLAPLPYPLSLVEQETKTHTKNFRVRNDGVTIRLDKDHVEQFVEDEDDGMSTRIVYMIKDANGYLIGTFVIERPSDEAKKAPGGADELFTGIEAAGGKMKFQRNPARCPGSGIENLTRHFQSNFGALYEFGPKGIDTEPFENAPDVVLQSLVYLKHFGEKALESSQRIASKKKYRCVQGSTLHMAQQPFNELLALAYRQTDKIDWHDDGEDQLTGVISTASFGSPGKMALRFKHQGKDKGKTILEVQLRHGDVATMCDTRLQALTDHTVIPDKNAMRRYAMTSRTINFDHYRQPKEKAKLVQKGLTINDMEKAAQIPEHALNFTYNGTTLGDQQEEAA